MSEEFWKRFASVPGFDCLLMKDEIQAKIYEEVKNLSSEELVAYFNRAGERLREQGEISARNAEVSTAREEPGTYTTEQPDEDTRPQKQ